LIRLKNSGRLKIPIILCAGTVVHKDDLVALSKLGVSDILPKPVRKDFLTKLVMSYNNLNAGPKSEENSKNTTLEVQSQNDDSNSKYTKSISDTSKSSLNKSKDSSSKSLNVAPSIYPNNDTSLQNQPDFDSLQRQANSANRSYSLNSGTPKPSAGPCIQSEVMLNQKVASNPSIVQKQIRTSFAEVVNILVVDEGCSIMRFMEKSFPNYDLVLALNVAEAIDVATQKSFNLIIIDTTVKNFRA
jgi:nitrous oxide reductase